MRTQQQDATGVRTVIGTVLGTGAVNAGTGFTATKTGTGMYVVRFTPPFRAWLGGGVAVAQQANVTALMFGGLSDSVTVQTFLTASNAQQDSHFSFVVYGLAR